MKKLSDYLLKPSLVILLMLEGCLLFTAGLYFLPGKVENKIHDFNKEMTKESILEIGYKPVYFDEDCTLECLQMKTKEEAVAFVKESLLEGKENINFHYIGDGYRQMDEFDAYFEFFLPAQQSGDYDCGYSIDTSAFAYMKNGHVYIGVNYVYYGNQDRPYIDALLEQYEEEKQDYLYGEQNETTREEHVFFIIAFIKKHFRYYEDSNIKTNGHYVNTLLEGREGEITCAGYAELLWRLCRKEKINCEVVTNNMISGNGHIYNAVQLAENGPYYLCDISGAKEMDNGFMLMGEYLLSGNSKKLEDSIDHKNKDLDYRTASIFIRNKELQMIKELKERGYFDNNK